ncbi:MAG: hypothetical protein EOO11_03975 [Chitinophagaceae bacterium]|nr:MAG: hypothetical protein EOO11_03975 [Chitinophagaceae bacterium]
MKRILLIVFAGLALHSPAGAQVTPDTSSRTQKPAYEKKKARPHKMDKMDKTMDHEHAAREQHRSDSSAHHGISPERSRMDSSATGISGAPPSTRMTDSASVTGAPPMTDSTGKGVMSNSGMPASDTLTSSSSNPAYGMDTMARDKPMDPMMDADKKVKTKTQDMKMKEKPGKTKMKHNKSAARKQ